MISDDFGNGVRVTRKRRPPRPPRPDPTLQEYIDRFYWMNGPCCAGCDYWRAIYSTSGLCFAGPPVGAAERGGVVDITRISKNVGAGQPVTPRDYLCGAFKDDFDWSTLPLAYLKQIGARAIVERIGDE